MRAVTFQAPGVVSVEERPEPQLIDPEDAIVRIDATGVCGSDLHIFHGRVQIEPGFTIGHEYVGTVLAAGDAVTRVSVGDRVLGCFQRRAARASSAGAATTTAACSRARSATAQRSARCRAPRPSRRWCRTPTSCCGACPRG